MPDLPALTAIIEPQAKALGFDLVRVAWFAKGVQPGDDPTLQIMAERPDTRQLLIDDCAALSRAISEQFDALDPIEEAYRLEVSSPGIDRPLTRLSDFADWTGHEAKVSLIEGIGGRNHLRGDLEGVDGNDVVIKDRKSGSVRFAFADLEIAKLILTDRLIALTAPINSDGADAFEQDEPNEDQQED